LVLTNTAPLASGKIETNVISWAMPGKTIKLILLRLHAIKEQINNCNFNFSEILHTELSNKL